MCLYSRLYQKGPSVAAIGIAVDFTQVISLFGALEMDWPGPILAVFKVASATASNADVTSPECSVSIGYIPKWYFYQGLPLGAIAVGIIVNYLHILFKLVFHWSRRKEPGYLTKHSPGMIGFFLLMLNFL